MHAVIHILALHQDAHDFRVLQAGALDFAVGIQLHLAVLIQQQHPPAQFAARGNELTLKRRSVALRQRGGDAHGQTFQAGPIRTDALLK